MMISDKMAARLNEQVNNEFYSSWIYMAMAYSFEEMNLKGFAKWFFAQAEEEKSHAMKIAGYIVDQGGTVKLKQLSEPQGDYEYAEAIVKATLEHEKKVTKQIDEIAALAESENDRATREFMNWFIKEQVEEVSTATDLLNMVQMAQSPGQLLMLQSHLSRD